MHNDFDRESVSCEGCRWLHKEDGARSCRLYGYFLHGDKGVSGDVCRDAMTEGQWQMHQKMMKDNSRRKGKVQ